MVMLLAVVLVGFGCVRGLQPIGWSGGAVAGDTLFVGSREGKLVAFSLADEGLLWSEPLRSSQAGGFGCLASSAGGGCSGAAAGVALYGTPVVDGDRVYIGAYNGKFYAFDTATLQITDVYPAESSIGYIVGGSALADGILYFGSSDGKVYALNADSFLLEWDFEAGDKIWATPAVSEGRVFIGSFDKKLYALDAADGTELWAYETGGAIVTKPLVHNGVVYFGSFDRYLYAVNIADGSLIWQFKGGNWFWAEPVLGNDVIYAACLDGMVYVINPDTGAEVARIELDSAVSSSPSVVGNNIIVASKEGAVYSIDAATNEARQLAVVEEEIYGPLTVSGEVVYIHTQDLTLHRVNIDTGVVLRSVSLASAE
jgi:outer membrane protein assembly factor BamB